MQWQHMVGWDSALFWRGRGLQVHGAHTILHGLRRQRAGRRCEICGLWQDRRCGLHHHLPPGVSLASCPEDTRLASTVSGCVLLSSFVCHLGVEPMISAHGEVKNQGESSEIIGRQHRSLVVLEWASVAYVLRRGPSAQHELEGPDGAQTSPCPIWLASYMRRRPDMQSPPTCDAASMASFAACVVAMARHSGTQCTSGLARGEGRRSAASSCGRHGWEVTSGMSATLEPVAPGAASARGRRPFGCAVA